MKTNVMYRKQMSIARKMAEWITRHNAVTAAIEAAAVFFTAYYIFMFA